MVIPLYPKFKPLEIEDFKSFDKVFRNDPPVISELTFTNLFSWRDAYHFRVSMLDDFILLKSEANKKNNFLPPLGIGDVKRLMENILSEANNVFMRIPESVKSLFEADARYKVFLDRDNSDYLFKTLELINLKGEKYDGKRNLIKKFKSTTTYEYLKLKHDNINECLDFQEEWCLLKDCESIESLKNERRAVREMVAHCSLFGLVAGAIQVNGKIRALAIGQPLNDDTFVVHVLKADSRIPGLYQTILNEFLVHEARDFDFTNLEQDLGIEGLRKFKLSYHPLHMINKYTITHKG
jgi:hypothetical protein